VDSHSGGISHSAQQKNLRRLLNAIGVSFFSQQLPQQFGWARLQENHDGGEPAFWTIGKAIETYSGLWQHPAHFGLCCFF
jgi:hypothetical protein